MKIKSGFRKAIYFEIDRPKYVPPLYNNDIAENFVKRAYCQTMKKKYNKFDALQTLSGLHFGARDRNS